MEIVISIAATIGECLLTPIGRQPGYLIYYNSNMRTLKTQVEKLGHMKLRVQHSVDAAKANGELIAVDVEEWLTRVNEINVEVERIFEDEEVNKRCLRGRCPNLSSRYSLSRKAEKKTWVVIELQGEGSFETVSYHAPPLGIEYMATGRFADFESRKSIIEEIMVALKDDSINAIGICGLGGIGKTTTVKEVGKRAKAENLFDEIVMAVVSQTPDLKKIQDEIADNLGLKFNEQSLPRRADRLRARLMNCKRVLIILDDVWARLDLEEMGIPFGGDHKGCKVMLTSRSQAVCKDMRTRHNFTIGVLSEPEAWSLFKEMAGNSIDSPNLHPIAKDVVKECGSLPIAIVTVGRALENEQHHAWNDALIQLRKSILENIPGMDAKVYRSLKLSYDCLESQEAKSCLLLCSIFEVDTSIPIEDLVRYGMGLGLFRGIDTLEKARDKVHELVDKLKSCYLLLDSDKQVCVKMNVVVRAVIRSIATTKGMDKQYTSISLISNELIHELPDQLDCPKLELLQLACPKLELPSQWDDSLKAQDNLFEGMKELKVLELRRMFIPTPPTSLSLLTKLQTLCLQHCMSENISVIGELETLRVLSFQGSSIKELPREIGKLTHLRLLDLTGCVRLTIISPGVISSLIRLEELYMRNSFVQWEVEEGSMEKNNANLTELLSLSHLIALEIHLPTTNFMGSNLLFTNLVRFKISVSIDGDSDRWSENQFGNELRLQFDAGIPVESGINMLHKKNDTLQLAGKGVNNVTNGLIRENIVHLKSLKLYSIDGLEYLIDTVDLTPHSIFPILESLSIFDVHNLKMICHGQLSAGSFGKLRDVHLCNIPKLMHLWKGPTQLVSLGNLRRILVEKCDRLENVFSQYVARGLAQLQDIEIRECKMIEEIVETERGEHGKETTKIRFPKLSELTLHGLPSIIGFCKKMDEIEFPQLSTLYLRDLPKLTSFCPKSLPSEGTHDTATQHLLNEKVKSLRSMVVHQCDELLYIFSSNLVQSLQNPEELEVENCGSLEVVFDFEGMNIDEGHAALTLTCLKNLKLFILPKLTHIWKKAPQGIQGFQNLRSLEVVWCCSLKNIFSPSIAKLLVRLEILYVKHCEMMEEIVGKDQEGREENEEAKNVIVFPQVNHLHLEGLPNFLSFCPEPYILEWPSLKKLLLDCTKMKTPAPPFLGPRKRRRTINVRSHEELQEGYFNTSIQHHLFNEQVMFPSMEVLELRGKHNVERIVHGQLPAESLCKLREMRVQECNKLLNVVPSNLLQRLQNLEELTIRACASLVEVFEIDGLNVKEREDGLNVKERDIMPLSKLKKLDLEDLPELKHILKREPKGILFFESLSVLRVWNCNSLRNLFSPSMAKSVEELVELDISACRMMTEIIAQDKGEEDEKTIEKFEFLQLRCLTLCELPNLVSIFPKANTTASNFSRTENLRAFDVGSGEILQEVNLLTHMQHLFNEKVSFPSLEELNLSYMNLLNEIWCRQLPTCSFCELRVLKVFSCDKLLCVAPFHLLRRLHNLEEVTAIQCDSLEEIFEFRGLSAKEGHAVMLPRLKEVTLESLPKLMKICKKDHDGTMGFQNLKSLKVTNCGSLRNLFYPSMARRLVHLNKLSIDDCVMMEEIVAKEEEEEEEEEEERMDKIMFPQLKSLELSCLTNLTSFCQDLYAFDLPSLEDVIVNDCPKMKTFCFGFLSTPKLEEVKVGFYPKKSFWRSDLNNTIKHLFERKEEVERRPFLDGLNFSAIDPDEAEWMERAFEEDDALQALDRMG